MGDRIGGFLEQLVESGSEEVDRLALIERLFTALPPERQERLLRDLIRELADPASRSSARAPDGHQPHLRVRPIGPWRMCCRMMEDIDRAPSVDDVDPGLPAEVFGALGDETRLRIIRLLQDQGRPFEEIARILRVPRSTLSHHLRVLRDAGLVEMERRGRSSHYFLAEPRDEPGVL